MKINIKLNKIIYILLIVIFINIIFSTHTYVAGITEDASSFIQRGGDSGGIIDEGALHTTSDTIYNVLLTVAVIIAVIVGGILGIQFMVASIEEKAKIKESLVPYLVGCFVIFSAFGIWKIAVNIGNSFEGTTSGGITVDEDGFSESGGTTVDEDGFSGDGGEF